jgi:hypothetical protein
MSYTYSQYQTDLANLLVLPSSDPNYVTVLPNIIDDAEQRIYRELDLLNTIVIDSSAAFSTGTRSFTLPSTNGTFVVTQHIYAITPSGTTNPDLGTRNVVNPAARDVLDFLFPSSTASGVPQYFAMSTQGRIIVGPWPDQAYQVEVHGTIRPAPLSASNVTTLLTQYFPDLFMAASMVFAAGYLQNFGAAADNPQMAGSWETHYKNLMASAQVEEARKKFSAQGWSPRQPSQLATPPQT